MDALADAADRCLLPVWWLAHTGFTAEFDALPTYVGGVESPDEAYRLTETVVTALLTPARRKLLNGNDAMIAAAIHEARTTLFRHAARQGRLTTISDEQEAATVPSGTPDLDAILSADGTITEPETHHFRRPEQSAAVELVERTVANMDDRSRQLVDLRWVQDRKSVV